MNYVRKFLGALHLKWRAKVTAIEESKDLTSLSLIGNLKVHEMIIKKDSEIVKAKVKRKSIPLKAKKESSDEECSTSGSEEKSTAWRKTFQRIRDDKNGKSDRKCFRCCDPNHLIRECPKPTKDKNQRAFVGGSWSDSEEDDEKVKDETCLVAHASSEIKDSICSKHMTGNRKLFSIYKAYNGGNVIFGSNLRGKIIGKGQICNNKCRVTFSEHDSEITKDGKVIGKQAHASHKAKNVVSMIRCLELLHVDLFGPSAIRSYGGNCFTLVIVDDYSRKIQNQLGCSIVSIRIDHGREFDNEVLFEEFCNANGITHNFSAPRTPQSNGVAERKNKTLQEMSRTMLNEQSLPQKFWCYSQNSKAYIVLNKHTKKVEESLNVTFDETPPPSKTSPLMDDDLDEEEAIKVIEKKNLENDIIDETLEIDEIVNIKESRNHPLENVIGILTKEPLGPISCLVSSFVPASKRLPKPLTLKQLSVSSDTLKKQTALVISTTEAEYINSKKACQQALWIKQALIDYDVRLDNVPIMCDNKGAIDLSKTRCNILVPNTSKYITTFFVIMSKKDIS
nr:retrovirus-related Pol polyprotein from transposon TNT 1-94 [Tanacetum cinerariifolium]